MNKKILVASGQKIIDDTIATFEDYEVIGRVEYRNELKSACEKYNPEVILIGVGLLGQESILEILLQLDKDYPNMRIVYLAGYVDVNDEPKSSPLGYLAMAGIYDINHDKNITKQMLKRLLDNPKTEADIEYLTKRVKNNIARSDIQELINFEIPEDKKDEDEDVFNNVFVVSSIKPGCGKSFVSTNIATAIAAYGVEINGRKPKVALIEADLQNLSVGTILQIEDNKKNLKEVMKKISTVVKNGKLVGNESQLDDVNSFIKNSFIPFCHAKNLEALVGSQLAINEVEDIKPYYYIYLINAIASEYDVVIVDTNSSITHVTTFPILNMAKTCYYLINLDFNNIRNNIRYKDFLKEIGVIDKVKYVLNEDIINNIDDSPSCGVEFEELIFTAQLLDNSDFKLEAKIPLLPKTVFLNRLYEGTPVVLDDKKYTLKARYELLKVANQIWPIKNLKELETKVQNLKVKKKKKLFN